MNCIVTCVTPDFYQWYIPTFVYSARRAMPDVDIKIFIQGQLDGSLRSVEGADIEEIFSDYPPSPSILRFLVPGEKLAKYDMVYFTDIDFVFLPHGEKTLFDYHRSIMGRLGMCYAGHRGPLKAKDKPWKQWDGRHTRIAGGAFMATREWFLVTRAARNGILLMAKRLGLQYREQDEVLLYHICKSSGLPTPKDVGCFICGKPYNITYRDLHLGDFKFDKRWVNMPRMRKKFLTDGNVKEYIKLSKDQGWLSAKAVASKNPLVRLTLDRADDHVCSRS